jgi:selenide, water dikinase
MLANLTQTNDPNLLVGYKTNDDAGVYRLTDDLAIVITADFITPPVNDPYQFGQIAAANALSDVYAMGGEPKVCLNLVCFPSKKLPAEDMNQIVAGALDKITEAGAVLAGGHSVEDDEPKFGLSVVGVVHPDKLWTNAGARPGDALVLTKPLGSGVLFNANLKGWVSKEAMSSCIETLIFLNRGAAKAMNAFDIHGVTDITGFGLAGHSLEMAKASNATLQIRMSDLPIMDEALEMYRKGMNTGVNAFNEKLVVDHTHFTTSYPHWHEQIIYDPQTSGGLLASLPADQAPDLISALEETGAPASALIGETHPFNGATHLIFT